MIDPQAYLNYLSSKNIYIFSEDKNTSVNIPILNEFINWQNVSEYYHQNQFVVVDNILNEEVCYRLREFKLTTNYRDGHEDIYFKYGYESIDYQRNGKIWFPLLEEVVSEFSKNIPFLHNLIFERAWSFIYNTSCAGVDKHADPALINCNLWVTPDECVINNPDNNGLDIWPIEHPSNWCWSEYNKDVALIDNFLNENNVNPIKIKYKFNRCVFFNSKFFHKTQPVFTKNGHENKRINFTFLFK